MSTALTGLTGQYAAKAGSGQHDDVIEALARVCENGAVRCIS